MKEQIDLLVELQQKDQALDRLGLKMREGPERIRSLEGQLQSLEAEVESVKARIVEVNKAQREHEGEIEDGVAHTRKSRGKLMSIKNNKEYGALVKEIEETEKANAAKEEMVLSCLEEVEKLSKEIEAKESSLTDVRDSVEAEKKIVLEEVARVEKEISGIEGLRKRLRKSVDPRLLAKYDQIKGNNEGVALALVNNATCSACHLGIPPQMFNELQRQNRLELCPHCQRIIYWKEVDPNVA